MGKISQTQQINKQLKNEFISNFPLYSLEIDNANCYKETKNQFWYENFWQHPVHILLLHVIYLGEQLVI